jgi:metal-responsive CopG/Arc/MetJ family transcriptional regulator
MKPVQLLFDEALLAELDSDERVKSQGRSRVLRGLVSSYLDDRRKAILDSQYAAGYGGDLQVSEELNGWDEEGEWPAK